MAYIYLSISWIIFYTFHSYGASDQLKAILQKRNFSLNRWRLIYSILSVAGLIFILLQMAIMKDEVLWPPNRVIKLVSMILVTYGLIIVRLEIGRAHV